MSWNWISTLNTLVARGAAFTVVTVTRCTGSTPRETGAKMFVLEDGQTLGTIGGGQLEKQAIQDALECMKSSGAKTITYPLYASVGQCCGGVVELLMETINKDPMLFLFGAGHVGQALCKTLNGTAFQVHLIDQRENWLNGQGLPENIIRHPDPWEQVLKELPWDERRSYVAIMTHEHELDREILGALIEKPTRYIGMIGSEAKWKSFQAKLTRDGASTDRLCRVRCPIGIDTGGKSPQEIAISIAAELLQIHYGAGGGR